MTRRLAVLMRMHRAARERGDLVTQRLVFARIHAMWKRNPSAWWDALGMVYPTVGAR